MFDGFNTNTSISWPTQLLPNQKLGAAKHATVLCNTFLSGAAYCAAGHTVGWFSFRLSPLLPFLDGHVYFNR